MSVVHVNSISGITSITTPSSSNVLTLHTSNNAERLRITSNGSVGIGTNDPTWGLSGAGGLIVGSGGSSQAITIFSGTTNVGDLSFGDATSGTARYRGLIRYDHDDNSFAFRTNSNERLRITSAGRLGIGLTNPTDLLTISHAANSDDGISIVNTNNSQASAIAQLELSGGDNSHGRVQFECNGKYATIRHDGNGHLTFWTNGSNERLRIKSDGKVGIGTDNPDMKVEVYNGGIKIDRRDGGGTSNPHFSMRTGPNGSSRLMIYAEDYTDDNSNWVYKTNANEDHIFHTAAAEKFRINSSGYVGVKRSTPLANLHTTNNELALGANPTSAAAPNATYDGLVVDGEAGSWINIRSRGNGSDSYGRLAFSDDVRGRAYVEYRHKDGGGDDTMRFATAGSERFRISHLGHAKLLTGNLEFASGNGIDFSANPDGSRSISTDGNKFDEYEEGTFTPSINGMGSIGYNTQAGKYTKIGNTVFFQIRFDLSSRTAGSHAHITNMPFTASTATIQYAQCTVYAIQGLHCSSNHHPIGQFQSSEIYLYQVGYQSSSNYSAIDENQISGTAQFGVFGFYYTAT